MFLRGFFLLLLASGPLASSASARSGWKDALRDELEAAYPLSKRAALSTERITKQGAVLVIRKDGITADLSSDVRLSVTDVKANTLAEQGGAVSALFTKKSSRVFKAGERVFVLDIKVKDEYIMMQILSTDTFDVIKNGNTMPIRYKGVVKFIFDEGFLETADASRVKTVIDSVLQSEAEAAATNTKTVALAQTRDQVEAILGKPEKIFDLGPKVTYVYKDMKVIFTDGKVSDVQ